MSSSRAFYPLEQLVIMSKKTAILNLLKKNSWTKIAKLLAFIVPLVLWLSRSILSWFRKLPSVIFMSSIVIIRHRERSVLDLFLVILWISWMICRAGRDSYRLNLLGFVFSVILYFIEQIYFYNFWLAIYTYCWVLNKTAEWNDSRIWWRPGSFH